MATVLTSCATTFRLHGPDGTGLRDKAARLENLLSRAPVWIIVAEQLLQGCLASDFGPAGARQLHLRRIAAFDKPGAHTQLAIYEIK
jgi:hypothetical protein